MLSGNYWPAHPHPYEGELFSCWLVRLIHANGLKIQTFCDRELDKNWQLWNRDIDRLAPDWLVTLLSKKTGSTPVEIKNTTLLSYHGLLFDNTRRCGELKWILPLGIYHRTRRNYGLQFCPACLSEDKDPYFRKVWRSALYTFCPKHNCMLHEKCPQCSSAIIFYRTELGKPEVTDSISLLQCWKCNFNLSTSEATPIPKDDIIITDWRKTLIDMDNGSTNKIEMLNKLSIAHHFCKLMNSRILSPKLLNYLSEKINFSPINLTEGRFSIERRLVLERYQLIYFSLWLLYDLEKNLLDIIENKIIRFNHLLKDYENPSLNYLTAISKLPHRKISKNHIMIKTLAELS